jgi:hypothetical protein
LQAASISAGHPGSLQVMSVSQRQVASSKVKGNMT